MKILIASGGTKAAIDTVRDVTNKSKGRFGAEIAKLCVEAGHDVTFLRADGSESPFVWKSDQTKDHNWSAELQAFADHYNWCQRYRARFEEVRFEQYGDYVRKVEMIVPDMDAVVLAAAVSDYSPKYKYGKISTLGPLTVEMSPNTKVISRVRGWNPKPELFLVGFKMLVGASFEPLILAATMSIRQNKCDMVVANDYETLHLSDHKTLIIEPDQPEPGQKAWECKHHKSSIYTKDKRAAAVVDRLNQHAQRISQTR